jgi:hypothetical protein
MDVNEDNVNTVDIEQDLTNNIIDSTNDINQVEFDVEEEQDVGDGDDDDDDDEGNNINNNEDENIMDNNIISDIIDMTQSTNIIDNNCIDGYNNEDDDKEQYQKNLDDLNTILEIRDKTILEANNKITSLGSYIDELLKEIETLKENSIIKNDNIDDIDINNIKQEDGGNDDNNNVDVDDEGFDNIRTNDAAHEKNLKSINSKLSLNSTHKEEKDDEEDDEEVF